MSKAQPTSACRDMVFGYRSMIKTVIASQISAREAVNLSIGGLLR